MDKKTQKSLDYDLSNAQYNNEVSWNLFNALYRVLLSFGWLYTDFAVVSKFDLGYLRVPIFLAHLL